MSDHPETPEARAAATMTAIVRGATEQQALALAIGWGATPKEAVGYVEQAHAAFLALARTSGDLERGKALAQLLDLYAKTYRNSDYQRALAVRKEMSTLLGIGAAPPKPAKVERDPLADEIDRLEKELGVS
jgi:hypothetical protein